MRNVVKPLTKALLTGVMSWVGASALAVNITVWDGVGVANEDGETEPGTINNQSWDLEAVDINGPILSIIGGFPMLTGNSGMALGDIFLDFNNDHPGPVASGQIQPVGGKLWNKDFKYDYVIHFNHSTPGNDNTPITSYSIYQLQQGVINGGNGSELRPIYYSWGSYPDLDKSNPYRFQPTSETALVTTSITSGVNYLPGLSDAQILSTFGIALTGGSHNVLQINLSPWIGALDQLHLTLQCGNDTLLGDAPSASLEVPDGGGMLALLGIGMGALGWFGRRQSR